jgi:predicted naringenin-chalcone synthase
MYALIMDVSFIIMMVLFIFRFFVDICVWLIYFLVCRTGLGNNEGIDARQALYLKHAVPLSIASATEAIENWGGNAEDISHVVAVTCTGVIVPGIEFYIMNALKMKTTTQRLSLQFMGCFGALSGLKAAKALCKENPKNRVLVVCTELCSLHLQLDDRIDNLIATNIFGDGSGAFVLGCKPTARESPLFSVHRSRSEIIPNSIEEMKWILSSTGLLIGLSKDIPKLIGNSIEQFVHNMLDSCFTANDNTHINVKDCRFGIHPGGRAVLEMISSILNLDTNDCKESWSVMKSIGNCSSATLVFIWKEMAKNRTSGQWCPCLAFGPGLSTEGAMLRAV